MTQSVVTTLSSKSISTLHCASIPSLLSTISSRSAYSGFPYSNMAFFLGVRDIKSSGQCTGQVNQYITTSSTSCCASAQPCDFLAQGESEKTPSGAIPRKVLDDNFPKPPFSFVAPSLTLLEPQSRFGDNSLKFQVVCPQNGTGVLKGLNPSNLHPHATGVGLSSLPPLYIV